MNARPALVLLLAACGGGSGPALAGLDGTHHAPLDRRPGQVHVVVFTSHECPIANAYAPALRELAARCRDQPVRWFVVHVDPDLGLAQAREHAAQYELPGTVLVDPRHDLARALGAVRTPEVFVLADYGSGAHGLAYRGRIDDQWQALGARRQQAGRQELRDALDAVLAGRLPAVAATDVVGCLLPEPRR